MAAHTDSDGLWGRTTAALCGPYLLLFCYYNSMKKHAIFLGGPIGVGKTTLGQALANRLSGKFIDGDDFSSPDQPWYCSILRTSRAIVQTGLAMLEDTSTVVIAYPLGCVTWIYFRRKFGDAGVRSLFVSLRASYSSIIAEGRGRAFSREEHDRIQVMIAEGYGVRAFSDLILDTDNAGFAATLERLEAEIQRMVAV